MLTFGGLLSCGALLALAASALMFRRSDAPRWTTSSWVAEMIAITLVSVFAMGIGYLAAGVIRALTAGLDPTDLGLLIVVLCISLVLWRRLDVRGRLRALDAEAEAPANTREGATTPRGVAPPAREPEPPAPTHQAA